MNIRFLAASAAALSLAGCAIHPLPEDVTGLDTNAIVLQIRCEAREGLKQAIVDFVLNPEMHQYYPLPDAARAATERLERGETSFSAFDPGELPPFYAYYIKKYETAAIAYDFQFDMSVRNDAKASVDFLRTIPHQTISGGIGGGAILKHQTIRNFRITDTFGGLKQMQKCEKGEKKFENYMYPVAGHIGIAELVKTFINLREHNNLTGNPKEKDKETIPVLADTFAFSTTLSGSANADIGLKPETSRLHLASASLSAGAERADIHTLTVAMSHSPKKSPESSKQGGTGVQGLVGSALGVNSTYAGFGKTLAEQRALIEIDYQKTINSLNNLSLRPF